ncbi:MAG: YdcF family protein [Neisseriaceae bacterium]
MLFIWVVLDQYKHRSLKSADAAIILGAAAWGKYPSPVLKNRIKHAVELYKKGLVRALVFTGGTPKQGFASEAEVASRWAHRQHIPLSNILQENSSRNTYENLLNTKKITQSRNLSSFILVSDAYHLPRAKVISWLLGMQVQTSAATPAENPFKDRKHFYLFLQETASTYHAVLYHFFNLARAYFSS